MRRSKGCAILQSKDGREEFFRGFARIRRAGGGNQLFLDVSKSPRPVKVWFHDEKGLVIELAGSFGAFL
jgi:hypothetical protein